MSSGRRNRPKIGVYGRKTRALQNKLTRDLFALSPKDANVHLYLGSRSNINPSINDIQNKVFMEVPDRAYADEPINIPIGMDPIRAEKMDFSRFGLINPMQEEQLFRVHVDVMKECLGRMLIIGDVLEIPFFKENCDRAFWEITDVDNDISFEQFFVVIHAVPLGDNRTTKEIPIDRSNEDVMDDIMKQTQDHADAMVSHEGLDATQVDPDAEYPTDKVDYRKDKQASFLDDPHYTFNNEDN